MISQTELEGLLNTLPRDQRVNLGIGDPDRRVWFRAEVVSHDPSAGQLVLKCFMDRPGDPGLIPGDHAVVYARRLDDDELHSAPTYIENSSGGRESIVQLRVAGTWQLVDERRQQIRVPLRIRATRARRWVAGAWHELEADVVDLSSRGVGVSLNQQVRVSDRLSLVFPLDDGYPDLRVTVEVRHVRQDTRSEQPCRAGGLFRNLSAADHERVIRFIFAELRSR